MIYITGDTHFDNDVSKLNTTNFPKQRELTNNDYVIVLGDFGLYWGLNPLSKLHKTYKFWYEWYQTRNFTTLWIEGNHPISKDSEVLTDKGWKNIVEVWNNVEQYKLANFDIETRQMQFDIPTSKSKKFFEKGILVEGQYTKQFVAGVHNVIIDNKKIHAENLLGKTLKESQTILSSIGSHKGIDLTNDEIRLVVNCVMDATIVDYRKYNRNSKKIRIQWHLSKERKIAHLKELLERLGYSYTIRMTAKTGGNILQPYTICIYGDYGRKLKSFIGDKKELPKYFKNMTKEQLLIVLDEISLTDGSKYTDNKIDWITTSKNDADLIQECCISNGILCKVKSLGKISGFTNSNSKPQYRIDIKYTLKQDKRITIAEQPYNDFMYCFTMPLGTLITRLDGKVAFTGNCPFNEFSNIAPVTEMWGGKVQVDGSIIHLMRGQYYNIDGITIFTMGGAKSIDKAIRTEGVNWFREEEPSYQEMVDGLNTLEQHKNKVEYIFTHAAPLSIVHEMFNFNNEDSTTSKYLEEIKNTVEFNQWCFGHYHEDRDLGRFHCLYNRILPLNEVE